MQAEWPSDRFEQASRGLITVPYFLDHLLKLHFPPAILFNGQQTSIMKT